MHFERIPKNLFVFLAIDISKNVLLLSVDDLYTEMLTIETNANMAQWYITGLQM